ncbi:MULTISPECIES: exodeoxyribonuclease VII large subunit [Clostridia]|uniref:exodeoxyribonuclease VII large subunit n=1 Tax=Clostridia TaxID=186801 RepID=UPI000E5C6935|nr:exodeoxyribonuclease VII large subunit [Eubacterium sp. AF22-9]RGS32970.1 exodeoxyribonuclease VII large subunit [Eubacterium sp. AF22-9]
MAGVYTVKQVNSYIKNMFKQDFLLNSVSVKGEISNCKYHTSGHIYFTLKDADAALSVIMFASQAARLSFKLKDGMSVVVSGRVDVFDAAGKYQLYANTVQQEGIGELYQKYEQLKQYYEDMGYFAKEYKRPLPAFTRKLGVVTSKTGAAVQDIMNISRRRNPYIQIVLYPAYVQGEHAKQSVVNGIAKLDKLGLDCIIVGRGGGSIEDLWAFNEPEVVEAVFNALTPIISAVGHETDFTLTDFVADMRAPTPSAAAELAVTEVAAVENKIFEYERRLKQQMMYSLTAKRDYLERLKLQMEYLNPVNQIYDKRQRLMNIEDKLNMLIKRCVADNRNRLRLYASRLEGLSPLKKLDMGYGYIEDSQNDRIVSVSQVSPEDEITVYLKDGSIRSKVIEVGEAWQKH